MKNWVVEIDFDKKIGLHESVRDLSFQYLNFKGSKKKKKARPQILAYGLKNALRKAW